MNAIEIEGLSKTFGRAKALDGFDMTVREGEVHGFLGPNGAGKSTTIRILLGLARSDGGCGYWDATRGPMPSPCTVRSPMCPAMSRYGQP